MLNVQNSLDIVLSEIGMAGILLVFESDALNRMKF